MVADTYAGVFTTTHTPIVSTANKMPTGFYELTPTEAYIARSDRTLESCIYQYKMTNVVNGIDFWPRFGTYS